MAAFQVGGRGRGALGYGMIGFALGALLMLAQAATGAPQPAGAVVSPGRWQLTEVGGPAVRSVCVVDPGGLFEAAQPAADCARFVLDTSGSVTTVRYTCGGRGHGRSVLRVHSARSVRLETQGIATGVPFAIDYDGRLVGPCAAPAAHDQSITR